MAYYGVGPIHFESVSNVTSTNSVELGTRRIDQGEEYVYCYNATGSAVTQGALMVQSGLSGYSLTRSSTAAADFPMVAVKHASPAAAQYFWGLVRGSVYLMSSVTFVKGDVLGIGADGKTQTHLVGSFPTGVAVGKALEVASNASAFLCYVNLKG